MTTIKLKNGSGAPTAGDLVQGEPALDLTNKRLYTEDSGGTVIEVGTNPTSVTTGVITARVSGAGSTVEAFSAYNTDGGSNNSQVRFYLGASEYNTAGRGLRIDAGRDSGADGIATFYSVDQAEHSDYEAIKILTDGGVTLSHLGNNKLATTSTGIDVTGKIETDGINAANFISTGSTYVDIGNGTITGRLQTSGTNLNIGTATTGASLNLKRGNGVTAIKASSVGDISFYEDTGTTAKFAWDAADETISIGLGASSTATISAFSRTVSASLPSALRIIENTGASTYWDIGANNGANPNLNFYVNANTSPKVTFASSGNVGIGVSSLVTGSTRRVLQVSTGSDGGQIAFADSTTEAANPRIFATNKSDLKLASANSGASTIQFITGTTTPAERMRIDSSGNVGIGTDSPSSTLDVESPDGTTSSIEIQGGDSNSKNLIFRKASAVQAKIRTVGDALEFGIGSSATEAMRIDADGNLLVGDSGTVGGSKFLVAGAGPLAPAVIQGASSLGAYLDFYNNGATTNKFRIGQGLDSGTDNIAVLFNHANEAMAFGTNATEAMRIDSSQNLLVGTTSTTADEGGIVARPDSDVSNIYIGHATGTAGGNPYIRFRYGSGNIGSITQSGTTAVLYNTSSDQRLKENIVDAPSASDDIDAIQVRSFDWKADGSHQKYGMVAQELQSVAPEAVTGDADSDDMMGVDYSKLVPMMMKEIQSLRARVAQLEGAN